jgi:hypothetical protein
LSKRYYKHRSRNRGIDAAIKHIEEAELLTRELGGTDQDVKQWFYDLSSRELDQILLSYEKSYGPAAGQYARETFPAWKSGKRKMSGLVAGRLFKKIPPFMPMDVKFGLVESLWNHIGPTRKRLIKAGPEVSHKEVVDAVISEVRGLVTGWEIPEGMRNRFNWLAEKDSVTYQKLLSHIKDQERLLGERVLKEQIPVLKHKFENELAETTSRLSYVIEVGKQSVELRMTSDITVLAVGDWEPISRGSSYDTEGIPWWLWLIGIAVVLFFLAG